MNKEGWAYLSNSRVEHYFVDGRSLCRKWLGFGLDYGRTMGQPDCKACQKALDKREAKKAAKGASDEPNNRINRHRAYS